jgi:RimJ/RimL family protein N-acetyltransferase
VIAPDVFRDQAGLTGTGVEFNPRARRVYEKCGFRVEGVRRDALRWAGAWHDAVVMAVLSTDER